MSWCFAFRWDADEKVSPGSVLVLAAIAAPFQSTDLQRAIDEDHCINLLPDRILLVMPETQRDFVSGSMPAILQDRAFLRIVPQHTSISAAYFDQHGRCEAFESIAGPEAPWPDQPFEKLKAAGLREIFDRRQVLMRPSAGLHFEHPRGVHSRAFLRTANALVSGVEIEFVAMTLLDYLKGATNRIWLDTSSIAALAYAMIAIRLRFDPTCPPLQVGTFSSYEGLARAKFPQPEKSLFLISATASGTLPRKLMQRESVGKDRVVSIYSAAEKNADISFVSDVSSHPDIKSRDGRSMLEVFQPDDCPWCRDNSRLARFVSDQFLADVIRYETAPILVTDAPTGLHDIAEAFANQGVFTLQRTSTGGHRIWCELPSSTFDTKFGDALERIAQRYVTSATSHFIHLDDPASKQLAVKLSDLAAADLVHRPQLVAASDLHTIKADEAKAVIVIAACIGSGNALLDVSRELRDILKDKPRIYIVGIAKNAEATRHSALTNDLVFNKSFKHELVTIRRLVMPGGEMHAWRLEERFLRELAESMPGGSDGDHVRTFVDVRSEHLRAALFPAGQNLFLSSPNETPLALRDGFAFWNDKTSAAAASQGDVIATIASVLHNMRTASVTKLWATAFHVMLIEPGMFGRYNDGVIQAALLRAAHPHELNYAARSDLSEAMRRIIDRALVRWNAPQGEAALEFLLAMGTGRLTLQASDCHKLRAPEGSPAILRHMLEYAQSKVRALLDDAIPSA
ncbi:hypothetical protein ASE66_12640 [Bosea sp. Root483D1]|uniref:hypothetical protein n=1 Tax=Bosea sp. Root483D1 TaxID=1736544 RepID=UPI00070A402B|nr:hypothetical protein [Bosea sp. Root483D1]KRE14242.1 hypothetical protein ASE66_12640 [Bosea sp. Root483D1]